jgi:hypothetical protein
MVSDILHPGAKFGEFGFWLEQTVTDLDDPIAQAQELRKIICRHELVPNTRLLGLAPIHLSNQFEARARMRFFIEDDLQLEVLESAIDSVTLSSKKEFGDEEKWGFRLEQSSDLLKIVIKVLINRFNGNGG